VKYDPKTHDGVEMFYALAQFQRGAPGLGFRVIWPLHVKEANFEMPPWIKP
jgi:hypothetical protein